MTEASQLHFASLADHLDLIQRIASWHVREWGTTGTEHAEWVQTLHERSQDGEIPFTLLAFAGDSLVGSVSVTWDDVDEAYSDRGPWLSGMIVQGPARNAGIGRALLREVELGCAALGHAELWLHTAEAHRFYECCGWSVIRPRKTIGYDTVMMRQLAS